MDIPKERAQPKKQAGPEIPNEAEILIGNAVGIIINTVAETDILSYIQRLHLISEDSRNPLDRPSSDELSEIESFLLSDHPSVLTKIEALEEDIARTKRTVEFIDETDFREKTLYDFIPKDIQKELEAQLAGLKNRKNLRVTLETEVGGICGEVWQDWQHIHAGTKEERNNHLETLIFGPEKKGAKKSINNADKEIREAGKLSELIGLEKARLCVSALTADSKTKEEKRGAALKIMGNEFLLIETQVAHMEKTLTKNWDDSDGGPIENPTEGAALIAPSLLEKMENGEPSPLQVKALEMAYRSTAERKTEAQESKRDKENNTIAFTLAAMETISLGKKAKMANFLKTARDLQDPNISKEKKDKILADAENTKGKAKEKLKMLLDRSYRGAGKIIEQWPMFAFMSLWKQTKQVDTDHYANMEEHVAWMRNEAQMAAIDGPL